ncbi:MAG: NADH-quinone oxidoreductase subunit I [Planctomycetes bacterium]|nr:NADH-quinone oxidoreductase subunit I [Planctomycetota bacterium]
MVAPTHTLKSSGWFNEVWLGFWTALVGMRITLKYFFKKPETVQYPEERMPIPDRYRGIHYLEQEKCIYCFMCARACPVDCISMEAVRHGKELEWVSFTVDYNRCMFCELCTYPCPKDCIHEGKEFALVTYDRRDLVLDLLSWKGMSAEAKQRFEAAEAAKASGAAAKDAPKAGAAPADAPEHS